MTQDEPVPMPTVRTSRWDGEQPEQRTVATIADAARVAAATWPGGVALVDGADTARRWTFAELLADAEHAAGGLLERFSPGEHLAVWAPNSAPWCVLEIAVALAGMTLVTVNPALGRAEAVDVLTRSDAVGVVTVEEFRGRDLAAVVRDARADLPRVRSVTTVGTLVRRGRAELPVVGPQAPAQIQFTSGTTGAPKGAVLAHRGLVDDSWLFARTLGAGPGDVWVNPMPLFHTAGCVLVALGALQTGGTHVVLPAFDADAMLDLLDAESATITVTVPTMLVRVVDAQRARPRALPALRTWALGGAPVAPELIRRARAVIGAGYAIGFGQTEASPYITHTLPSDPHPRWDETVGRPLPSISVRVADPGTGETVPTGVPGELCTRSRCVMIGYYGDPAATSAAIDDEGWLHTGDLATMDEHGYVSIVGRLRDMIIRGGENVYPREIEDLLLGHPSVIDVAVLGVPDPEWGEQVAAVVRARDDGDDDGGVDATALEDWCRARLASFKVPRLWRFVDEFPTTASGKIRKIDLRSRFSEGS